MVVCAHAKRNRPHPRVQPVLAILSADLAGAQTAVEGGTHYHCRRRCRRQHYHHFLPLPHVSVRLLPVAGSEEVGHDGRRRLRQPPPEGAGEGL